MSEDSLITNTQVAKPQLKIEKTQYMMRYAPVLPTLLKMSAPAILSMLISAMYNIVDSIYVSMLSEKALRAVTIVFPVQTISLSLILGMAVGANSFVARSLGARDQKMADRIASHGLVLGILTWLFTALAGFICAPAFAAHFTQDASVFADTVIYMRVVSVFSLGFFMHIVVEKLLQATGNTVMPMLINLLSTVINIVLDPIFIFGKLGLPAMGVTGAAVATVISQCIGGAISLVILITRDHNLKIDLRGFCFDSVIIKEIYRVGVPNTVMMIVSSFIVVTLNTFIKDYSEVAISVLGLYFKLESFAFMPAFGLNQGAVPLTGYNYGAGQHDRMGKILKYVYFIAILHFAVCTLIFELMPALLLDIFSATPEMLGIGIPLLRIFAISYIFAGFNIASSGFFIALGKGGRSFAVSMVRQVVLLLPLAYIFSRISLDMVWWCYPISEFVALFVSMYLVYKTLNELQHKSL